MEKPALPFSMKPPAGGFSMIELMVVLAIVAILALMAAPNFQYKVARDQKRRPTVTGM